MNTPKCILCGNNTIHIKYINKFNIYKCGECGLEFSYPMPTDDELRKFYNDYYDIQQEESVAKLNAVRNIKRLEKYGIRDINKYLLDYACGNNDFIGCGYRNWYGYDKFVKKRTTIEDYHEHKWDFVTIWGSLEHFTHPLETMKDIVSTMEKNGKLIMRQIVTDSNIPFRYKPPEHITYWNRKSLEILFDMIGLEIIKYEPYTMIQNSDVYLSCVLRTIPDNHKSKIKHSLDKYIEVPTNEVFIVGEKI